MCTFILWAQYNAWKSSTKLLNALRTRSERTGFLFHNVSSTFSLNCSKLELMSVKWEKKNSWNCLFLKKNKTMKQVSNHKNTTKIKVWTGTQYESYFLSTGFILDKQKITPMAYFLPLLLLDGCGKRNNVLGEQHYTLTWSIGFSTLW